MMTLTILLTFALLALCTASKSESIEWLAENSRKEGVVSLPSGLQYKVLKKGSGKFHPTIGSPTSCHYEGKLIDGSVFDSSYQRGSPTSFAPNQVIKGWTEAMQLMVEGDKWELYIPSELAYGERGSPPKIPPSSTLIFVMEMIEIEGDKVPAVSCDVVTQEDCTDKEKAYITKAKGKFGTEDAMQNEIDRIIRVSANVKDETKSWANARVKILSDLKAGASTEEL